MAAVFFSSAAPIGRGELLSLMQEVRSCSLLLCAPVGLPVSRNLVAVLGDNIANRDFKSIFQQWQEGLARRLYVLRGQDADVICSSLKYFMEERQDPEIMRLLTENDSLMTSKRRIDL